MFNIVLVEPEIPQNTGNIVRTCSLTGACLHLVKPLGFSVEDKYLKRAGLDYWSLVEIKYYESFFQLVDKYKENNFYLASTKANIYYTEINYKAGDFIVFGKETKGLSREILDCNREKLVKIPMIKGSKRSLNLSNTVNIILFEAMRQLGFPNLD